MEKLRYTGIPLVYYDNIIRTRFPESWKFWKHVTHDGNTYHGAPHNTTHINQTPFKDITNWNRMSAHVGHLPDTFDKFLRELGIPTRQVKSTITYVELTMKDHTIKMFKIYWKAVRDGCDHPNKPEEREDKDNDSEISEDSDNPTSPAQQLAWLARSDTDSSETDNTTSDESDLESNEEDNVDGVPLKLISEERLPQIKKENEKPMYPKVTHAVPP